MSDKLTMRQLLVSIEESADRLKMMVQPNAPLALIKSEIDLFKRRMSELNERIVELNAAIESIDAIVEKWER